MPDIIQAFRRRSTHPIIIDLSMFSMFGPEWLTWDPDDAVMAATKKIGTLGNSAKGKIYGLSVIHTNHIYWEDWRAFEAVSWALTGQHVDLGVTVPLSPLALLYGYRTSKWIDPTPKMSEEVETYSAAIFIENQFSLVPPEVGFLQERILQHRPDLSERADAVKSAIISRVPTTFDEVGPTPLQVELARHQSLEVSLSLVCSEESVMAQAKLYGLENMASEVMGSGK